MAGLPVQGVQHVHGEKVARPVYEDVIDTQAVDITKGSYLDSLSKGASDAPRTRLGLQSYLGGLSGAAPLAFNIPPQRASVADTVLNTPHRMPSFIPAGQGLGEQEVQRGPNHDAIQSVGSSLMETLPTPIELQEVSKDSSLLSTLGSDLTTPIASKTKKRTVSISLERSVQISRPDPNAIGKVTLPQSGDPPVAG